MVRSIWTPAALALGAVLAAGGPAGAQDDTLRTGGTGPTKSGIGGGFMTLAGKGTAAEAAAATDDVELTHGWKKRYYGGYYGYGRPYYGGFYGGGYYGGYYGGYRGYYGGYRGFYGGYHRPYYAAYRPYYNGFGYGGFGYSSGFGVSYSSVSYSDPWCYPVGIYGGGFYVGIGGRSAEAVAPAVALMTARTVTTQVTPAVRSHPQPGPSPAAGLQDPQPAEPAIRSQPQLGPSLLPTPRTLPPVNGTFPYDGGPASPVPHLRPEGATPAPAQPSPAPAVLPPGEIQVSLKVKELKPPAKPDTYKAYGEK
jgi:hypothetical protein